MSYIEEHPLPPVFNSVIKPFIGTKPEDSKFGRMHREVQGYNDFTFFTDRTCMVFCLSNTDTYVEEKETTYIDEYDEVGNVSLEEFDEWFPGGKFESLLKEGDEWSPVIDENLYEKSIIFDSSKMNKMQRKYGQSLRAYVLKIGWRFFFNPQYIWRLNTAIKAFKKWYNIKGFGTKIGVIRGRNNVEMLYWRMDMPVTKKYNKAISVGCVIMNRHPDGKETRLCPYMEEDSEEDNEIFDGENL